MSELGKKSCIICTIAFIWRNKWKIYCNHQTFDDYDEFDDYDDSDDFDEVQKFKK